MNETIWVVRFTHCIRLAIQSLLCSTLLVEFDASAANVQVLRTAESIARAKYSGFSYGDDPNKNEVNFVEFLGAVIEALLHCGLTKAERDTIYIRTPFSDVAMAVARGDRRTTGVVYALVDVMQMGRQVEPEEASSGDFIQYWLHRSNGTWMGHAAIVSKVWRDSRGVLRAEIFGAHKSINRIGFTSFSHGEGLALQGGDRKIYIARYETRERVPNPGDAGDVTKYNLSAMTSSHARNNIGVSGHTSLADARNSTSIISDDRFGWFELPKSFGIDPFGVWLNTFSTSGLRHLQQIPSPLQSVITWSGGFPERAR